MHPKQTAILRYLLDEFLPAVVRENRLLMSLLFRLWYKHPEAVDLFMNFKDTVHTMTEEEYRLAYIKHENRASARATDAFQETLDWIMARIDPQARTLLDVGCGNGSWIEQCTRFNLQLTGCDIYDHVHLQSATYQRADIEHLPFPDQSFDIVTCLFVLEHTRHLDRALSELKRVTRQQLFLAVPCQRYFKYTFDTHLHFFYSPAYFRSIVGIEHSECSLIGLKKAGQIVLAARCD